MYLRVVEKRGSVCVCVCVCWRVIFQDPGLLSAPETLHQEHASRAIRSAPFKMNKEGGRVRRERRGRNGFDFGATYSRTAAAATAYYNLIDFHVELGARPVERRDTN